MILMFKIYQKRSLCNTRTQPLIAEGLNARMIRGHHTFLSNEAIAIVGQIVLYVSVASISDLNVGAIGIGRTEARNIQTVSGLIGMVLNKRTRTVTSGLSVPIPA